MSAKQRVKDLGVKGVSEMAIFALLAILTLFMPLIVAIFWVALALGVYTGTWELTKLKMEGIFSKGEAKVKAIQEEK